MNLCPDVPSKKQDILSDEEPENRKEFVVHTARDPDCISEVDIEMTQVLPNLLMGPIDPALDRDLLKENSVRHVLTLGLLNVPHFDGISYTHMRLLDRPRFDVLPHLETAISVIDSARSAEQTVYVHCQAGVSRSSTVVIAYLMKHRSWTYRQAFDFLKRLRPCIEPNEGFVKQLRRFEKNILNN